MSSHLVDDEELERLDVVANCTMNRDRRLRGSNGYDLELGLDSVEFLVDAARTHGRATWLDICCGSGFALVEAAEELSGVGLDVAITGVDLVDAFVASTATNLDLVEASISTWEPDEQFDLVTSVHGLHYVGDKLGVIERCVGWLRPTGVFLASFDPTGVVIDGWSSNHLADAMHKAGYVFDTRRKLLRCDGSASALPFEYLGADAHFGPNYTGQPAVGSHYRNVS